MSKEIKDIIEKAMRDAFEAGFNEGYQDAVHDQKHDGVLNENSPFYIVARNTHWAEYLKTLNMPADQT